MSKRPQTVKDNVAMLVSKNIILSENIKQELKYIDKNKTEHFQLNPNRGNWYLYSLVVIIADKPNNISNKMNNNRTPVTIG